MQSNDGSGQREQGGHGGMTLSLFVGAAVLPKLGDAEQEGVTICVFNMYKFSSPGGIFALDLEVAELDPMLEELDPEVLEEPDPMLEELDDPPVVEELDPEPPVEELDPL